MKNTALILIASLATASALTVPVAQDTYSGSTGKIAAASGRGVTLAVNAKQTALIRFDLSDTNVVPDAIQPGNIQSATLRLYVVGATLPSDVSIHAITSDWQEKFTGVPVPLPGITAGVFAAIPGAELKAKSYVSVNVIDAVRSALAAGVDFGFALKTADPKAKITFASKEGAATGYGAELEIVANTALNAAGNLSVGDIEAHSGLFTGGLEAASGTFINALSVSSAFLIEPRPANNPALAGSNLFIGRDAGLFNNTGELNTFTGYVAGRSNGAANQNSFFGALAGRENTTGSSNSFFGAYAGIANETGGQNAFFGRGAGYFNIDGDANVAVGYESGRSSNGDNNVFLGWRAGASNTTESNNTFLGAGSNGAAGVTNSTAIGANATVLKSNTIVLGANCDVGIRANAPNSTLQLGGSLSLPIRNTGNLINPALTESDLVVVMPTMNVTATLPDTFRIAGRTYVIKNRSGGNVFVSGFAPVQTIDGNPTRSISANGVLHLITDGAVWFVIN